MNSKLTPKTPSDVNLADVTVAGLSYADPRTPGRRRGFCACCARSGFLLNRDGRLSRHGFTRLRYYGVTTDECQGSGMRPQDTVEVAVGLLTRSIANLEEVLGTDLVAYSVRRLRRERHAAVRRGWLSTERGTYDRDEAARDLRALRTLGALGALGLDAVECDWHLRAAAKRIAHHRANLAAQRDADMRDLDTMRHLQSNVRAAV